MKKRTISLLLAVVMTLSVCPTVGLAAGKGFSKTRTYADGQFPDVAATDWYAPGVKSAYEYGIMQGTGDGFGAHNTLSIAEAVAMAARLHRLYHTGSDGFEAGTPWYQAYVDYALANGILAQPYPDYTKAATRTEFVTILRNALPAEALEGINAVDDGAVPDVSVSAQGAAAIYDFYRAGILTGSDAKGSFQPEANIDRASVAAIIARMVEPALRQKLTLQVPRVTVYAKSGDQTKSVPVTQVGTYLAQGYQTTPAAASLDGHFQTYGKDDFVPESSGVLREFNSEYFSHHYQLDWAYGDGCLVLWGNAEIYGSDQDKVTVDVGNVREVYLKRGVEVGDNSYSNATFERYPAIDRIEIPDTMTKISGKLCTEDQPLTRVGIPESVTYVSTLAFGGYDTEVIADKLWMDVELIDTLKNKDLVIYCVPGSAASQFADEYDVRQVAATQVFYPDGRTCMVSSREKPEYLKKGWFEEPVTLMYNAEGKVQAVEIDQVETYAAQGWYEDTADFTVLYNDQGETKVAGKNEVGALTGQGWHQDVSGAVTTIYAED